MINPISFRQMEEVDLPMIHRWLNQPHMRPFYQKEPISLEQVITKFFPRIRGEVPTFTHIGLLEGKPFGKIQCYKIADYPEFASEIGVNNGISIDLFIGETSLMGKGLGKRFLQSYRDAVAFPLFPQENLCYICHEIENAAALATSRSCGFKYVRRVVESGANCDLLVFDRMASAAALEGRNENSNDKFAKLE